MHNAGPPLAAALAIALTAAGTARDRGHAPEAVPAGKPESCISIPRIRTTHVHGDGVIDFEMNGGEVYRNTLPNSCPGLGFREAFAYRTSLAQLCSTDIITVIETPPAVRGTSCGLGRFQPVTLVSKLRR